MNILITGVCGFVGSSLAESLSEAHQKATICGIDNLMRPGSETNLSRIRELGVAFTHGDIRNASDFESLPGADWVIDAAAKPSVLAGVAGRGTSRQLLEHNLASLINVLEYCREHRAGLILLSTSRVYSIRALASLPLRTGCKAFELDVSRPLPRGVSPEGIGPEFSTSSPISLYGSSKLASETIALEYGEAFGFPVWIDRCGALTGAGQFGTADQGIFSYWVNAHLRRRPLCYFGFGGTGRQVRDAFHPYDLARLIEVQMRTGRSDGQRIYTAGGGPQNAMSLAELTEWCDSRFGSHAPQAGTGSRTYDVPWVVMDNRDAERDFGWRVMTPIRTILNGIAEHAERHPNWLERSRA